MKVLVTGSTGFVGSHATRALLDEGHDVRVLARREGKVAAVLAPLGVDAGDGRIEVVEGDMTDPGAVGRAVDGCDAALHAAARLDVGHGEPGPDVNVEGVRTVVGRAVEAGLEPIVYTSTISAYVPTGAAMLTGDSPLAAPATAYGRSKRAAEELVRAWQAEGAPITSFVIGGVYGPISPHLDGSFSAVKSALETLMAVIDGGMGLIDVRDLALILARACGSQRGPARFTAGGRFISWAEWTDALSEAVGREVPRQAMTAEEMVEMGRALDRQRAEGATIDLPLSEDAALTMVTGVPTDDGPTLEAFAVERRPVVETFRDKVAWMVSAGHIDPTLAPAVADGPVRAPN